MGRLTNTYIAKDNSKHYTLRKGKFLQLGAMTDAAVIETLTKALGEYENIGLTPEEIQKMRIEYERICPPFNVGDTVYVVTECKNIDAVAGGRVAVRYTCPYAHDCAFGICDKKNVRIFKAKIYCAKYNGFQWEFSVEHFAEDFSENYVFATKEKAAEWLKTYEHIKGAP